MLRLIKVLSISLLTVPLMAAMCKHDPTMTSGICAWVRENYVLAKKTDDLETKRASADQIRWFNDNC
jgi:hypothetical protein